MGFLVIVAALYHGFLRGNSEQSIRLAGLVLQILGMCLALLGLLSIREHFYLPRLRVLLIKWWKERPKWDKVINLHVKNTIISVKTYPAHFETWVPDDPDKSNHERLSAIIQNIDGMRELQRTFASRIDQLEESHKTHKTNVAKENEALKNDFQTQLRTLHTSDFMLSLVGLIWLTVGIFLSTMAPELAKYFTV